MDNTLLEAINYNNKIYELINIIYYGVMDTKSLDNPLLEEKDMEYTDTISEKIKRIKEISKPLQAYEEIEHLFFELDDLYSQREELYSRTVFVKGLRAAVMILDGMNVADREKLKCVSECLDKVGVENSKDIK